MESGNTGSTLSPEERQMFQVLSPGIRPFNWPNKLVVFE